jgi:uncharacterized protein (DUF924 family)
MTSFDEVLSFWFGAPGTPEHGTARTGWFVRSPAFDDEVRRRFADLHAVAVEGGLEAWEGEARSTLALIIVLDQFSRNLHRDSARAFDGDARALALARWMVSATWDRTLTPLERQFVYMPFEHAESPEMQEESLRLFGKLAAYPETRDLVRWAEAHARIIERFGRFPHRNRVLGRTSTPEEEAFLKEPGSSF